MTARPKGLAELDDFDAVFAALAHRSRRTILSVLHARGGEMTSGAIAERFDCSWPTTTQHLRVLEQAGLVTIAMRGRERVYRLQADRLRAVAGGWLERFGSPVTELRFAWRLRMRLESVGKRYGLRQPWVVRDVSLDVLRGRLIRLEGRNGSGKSTLLRVAAGVTLPSKGRVTGRSHTGYVPERFPGALPFPARDYLLYMARVHGLRGAAVSRSVDEWLERLGAASYAAQPLRALSKGMCQKVAIAQALVSRPGLLILDEAWTGLDLAARGALDAAATERVADGGTVMFVDHEQARLAGRIHERWQLDGSGRVTVVPGGGAAGAPGQPELDDAVVVIELDGVGAGGTAIENMPGVLSCAGAPRAAVRVTAAASDRVLRQVLSWDGVHVAAVRTEAAAGPEPGPGRGVAEAEEAGW